MLDKVIELYEALQELVDAAVCEDIGREEINRAKQTLQDAGVVVQGWLVVDTSPTISLSQENKTLTIIKATGLVNVFGVSSGVSTNSNWERTFTVPPNPDTVELIEAVLACYKKN